MPTVRAAAEHLLTFMRKEQRVIPVAASTDDPLPAVLAALNGALTELNTIGPVHLFRARRSAVLYDPVSVTVPTITTGATSFVLDEAHGWQNWMTGCSIRVNSEAWNEIVDYDANSHTVTLLHPVATGGSNIPARIFCDSITLPGDVLQVMPPVSLADRFPLAPVHTLDQLWSSSYLYWRDQDYGFYGSLTQPQRRTDYRPAPLIYFVDTHYQDGYTKPSLRIRFAPMPPEKQILHYRARVRPVAWTMDDIYDSGSPDDDPGTPVPVDETFYHEAFLPIAVQRLTGSPFFRNDNALPEISRQYQLALTALRQMRPQAQPKVRIRPRF